MGCCDSGCDAQPLLRNILRSSERRTEDAAEGTACGAWQRPNNQTLSEKRWVGIRVTLAVNKKIVIK